MGEKQIEAGIIVGFLEINDEKMKLYLEISLNFEQLLQEIHRIETFT